MNDREHLVLEWLSAVLPAPLIHMAPASSDASFRRYFRVWYDDQTRIVMDAPPDKEDCRPFVAIAQALRGLGLNAPTVLDGDFDRGLLLLTDLGSRQYLAELNDHSVPGLYGDALEQPQVWVHRDYHSRNLMVTDPDNPGVLDFQDAVVGAVTYDLVSLLRDCYIAWPRPQVETWALDHRARLRALGMTGLDDADQFLRWFDLMGVQRHQPTQKPVAEQVHLPM